MLMRLFAQIISDPNKLNIPKGENVTNSTLDNALTIVFAIAGAVALLIIVLAGLKYVTSQGEPQEVAKAKNTIIYAIAGLVIAMLAYAIVRFIVRSVG